MSKIATFRRSVTQATEQRQADWQMQTKALEEATQHIGRLHKSLNLMPEQLAKRILPAAEALDAMVLTTNQTLSQVQTVLAELSQAKKDTELTTQMIEHQALRLEETASNLIQEQRQQSQKDLIKVAALSAIGAAILSLAVTLSALSFWPSRQAEIGQRVLDTLQKADPKTRDWLQLHFVQ